MIRRNPRCTSSKIKKSSGVQKRAMEEASHRTMTHSRAPPQRLLKWMYTSAPIPLVHKERHCMFTGLLALVHTYITEKMLVYYFGEFGITFNIHTIRGCSTCTWTLARSASTIRNPDAAKALTALLWNKLSTVRVRLRTLPVISKSPSKKPTRVSSRRPRKVSLKEDRHTVNMFWENDRQLGAPADNGQLWGPLARGGCDSELLQFFSSGV